MGASSTTTAKSVGNISLEFAATWNSIDNVKMLGVYGWAYYPAGSVPTQTEIGENTSYSNQIEYYIIQDRGSYNPASGGKNAKKYGSGTIDGIAYDFWVADRLNEANLTVQGRTLNINAEKGTKLQVKIMDPSGKLKANFSTTGKATHYLSSIPSGRYYIYITGQGVKQMSPIVVE